MQGQGVLFGQIVAVFSIVIAGVWGATQWTAAALGYQLRLGSPWFDVFGTPVYHPWRLFEWWFFFDAYAPHVFDIGGVIAGGSGLIAVVVAIAMSVWRSRQSKLVTTYGSARWAHADDVRKAGLTLPTGIFLGLHDGQYQTPNVVYSTSARGGAMIVDRFSREEKAETGQRRSAASEERTIA